MSRCWRLLPVLLLLAVPTTAAVGTLPAEPPLALYGDLVAEGPGLTGHHHAWENGTLAATLYRGTLERTVHEEGAQPTTQVVRTVEPNAPVEVQLVEGAIVHLRFPQTLRFQVGPSGVPLDKPPAGSPVALQGPTPAAHAAGAPEPDPWTHVSAFPSQGLLLVPQRGINTTSPFLLDLVHGDLAVRATDQEEPDVYHAGVRSQTRTTGGLPIVDPSQTVTVRILTTYHLNASLVVWSLRQDAADLPGKVWQGDLVPTANASVPAGHWPREEAGDLASARADRGLPATAFASDRPVLLLDGVLQLRRGEAAWESGLPEIAPGHVLQVGGHLRVESWRPEASGTAFAVRIDGQVLWARAVAGSADADDAWRAAAVVAGAVLVAGTGIWWAWPTTKLVMGRWFLVPLYARIQRDQVLEHPVRDDILGVVTGEPGISASEIGRRTHCGWGTLVYHLSVLERERLLWSSREGRHRRYFAQGRVNYSDREALGLLKNHASRRLADAIRSRPGVIQKDLSRDLGLAPSTIAWHVERLAHAGLVVREGDGRVVRYYPSPRLEQLSTPAAMT